MKVGGVLSTCVAGDGEDDFPIYTLSLLLTMLIILINSNWRW